MVHKILSYLIFGIISCIEYIELSKHDTIEVRLNSRVHLYISSFKFNQ